MRVVGPCLSARQLATILVTFVFLSLTVLTANAAAPVTVASPITTMAGNGTPGYSGDLGSAAGAQLNQPYGGVLDAAGNFYFADSVNNVVRTVNAATQKITTVAGNGTPGFSGDTNAATSAQLNAPSGVALDVAGNLYIADSGNNRIRKVNAVTQKITTVAGNGTPAYGGDNSAATGAQLNGPTGVALDAAGNLYIADKQNSRIRKVNATTQTITTVAGNGTPAYGGDNSAATSAKINLPEDVAVDSAGNLYIADTSNHRIRKVNSATKVITTVAGNGTPDYGGDNGAAKSANLNSPYGVTLDVAGNFYIADYGNSRIRMVNAATQIITTVAGNGTSGYTGDGIPATSAEIASPTHAASDSLGNLYISDTGNNRIREVVAAATNLGVVSVNSSSTAQNILLSINSSLTIGNLSVPQSQGGIQEFALGVVAGCTADGTTTIPAGTVCIVPVIFQPGYPGMRQAPLLVQTSAGMLQFGLTGLGQGPQAALLPGVISTAAGNGTQGYDGDTGPATSAQLNGPIAMAVDAAGNLYVADYANNVVRRVDAATQTITTVVGNGTQGSTGDNGAAAGAELSSPIGVALDAAGNLYIADYGNNVVRRVDAATQTITTIVGNGTQGFSGDNGAATSAELSSPTGVTLDAAGNLFIADYGNNRVRKVNAATQTIATVAGNGTQSFAGDNGAATGAALNGPTGVALDAAGNLYIADYGNSRIRRVNAVTQTISTAAGTGDSAYSGDGGSATEAALGGPTGVALDAAGNLYIADQSNNRIRKVDAASQTITTVAGDGDQDFNSDGIAATSAALSLPYSIVVDAAGNLYIADTSNNRVRLVSTSAAPVDFPDTVAGSASAAQDVVVSNTGNATLNLAAISFSGDFNLQGPDTTCSSGSQPLAAGATCVLGIEFAPTNAGLNAGGLTLTDDSLNATGATQSLALSGNATQTPQTITFDNPGTQTYGVTPFALSAAATSGLPVTFVVTAGPAGVNDNTLTVTGAGSVTVMASQAGNTNWQPATQSVTFTVAPQPLTITAADDSKTYGQTRAYGAASLAFSSSGLVKGDTIGSVTVTADGGANSTAAVGAYTLTPNAAIGGTFVASNYAITYDAGTLTVNRANASVTPNAATKSYGASDPGFTGTLSGFVPADNVSAVYTRTAGETVAGSPYTIAATLSPAGVLGNYNLTYNTAQFTITPAIPAPVSVTPNAGLGAAQTFSFRYTNTSGYASITDAAMLFNTQMSWVGSCGFWYLRGNNTIQITDGVTWSPFYQLGKAGTLDSTNCSLDLGLSSFAVSGNDLTVTLAITFKPVFSGAKNIYMKAQDTPDNLKSDYLLRGSWTPIPPAGPVPVSVVANGGTPASQSFSFRYTDTSGAAHITDAGMLFNAHMTWIGSCGFWYLRGSNSVQITDGNTWSAFAALGSAGTLNSTYCSVDLSRSSAVTSGNDLIVTLAITFKPAFAGAMNVYMKAQDTPDNLKSDYIPLGAWRAY